MKLLKKAVRIKITFVITSLLFSNLAFAGLSGLDPEFGLIPNYGSNPNPHSDKHVLPNCDLFTNHREYGLQSDGYCLGPVNPAQPDYGVDTGVMTILAEIFDEDGSVLILRRNPLLMSLAAFVKFCGKTRSDKLTCEYKITF